MPTPDFILDLRRMIGSHPLWLSGVTAVVVRDREVLLVRRADTGEWTPVTGIIDPGEHPAVAARREVLEEAGVEVTVERLSAVGVTAPLVYENGDRAQYLDLTFRCRWDSGEPHPADGENTEARWFLLDDLPDMTDDFRRRLRNGLSDEPSATFEG